MSRTQDLSLGKGHYSVPEAEKPRITITTSLRAVKHWHFGKGAVYEEANHTLLGFNWEDISLV